ncbi:MAG: thioesterase family protein [Pseudomonadota bacterium]
MSRPGFAFSTRIKVRYSEIDGQKVVFNSRYLEYADVALTAYWDWADIAGKLGDEDWQSHVRRAEVDYLKPFVFGDSMDAWVRIERIGGSSFTQRCELTHAVTGELHAVVNVVGVGVDLSTGRSLPHSPRVRAFLEGLIPPP